MFETNPSRRDFLRIVGVGTTAAVLPACLETEKEREFRLAREESAAAESKTVESIDDIFRISVERIPWEPEDITASATSALGAQPVKLETQYNEGRQEADPAHSPDGTWQMSSLVKAAQGAPLAISDIPGVQGKLGLTDFSSRRIFSVDSGDSAYLLHSEGIPDTEPSFNVPFQVAGNGVCLYRLVLNKETVAIVYADITQREKFIITRRGKRSDFHYHFFFMLNGMGTRGLFMNDSYYNQTHVVDLHSGKVLRTFLRAWPRAFSHDGSTALYYKGGRHDRLFRLDITGYMRGDVESGEEEKLWSEGMNECMISERGNWCASTLSIDEKRKKLDVYRHDGTNPKPKIIPSLRTLLAIGKDGTVLTLDGKYELQNGDYVFKS